MSDQVISLSKANFNQTVGAEDKTVLVDFWAPWCGPCRQLAPEIDALAKEVGAHVTIAKVNVDEEPELAQQFGIQSIPNLVVFKKGKPVRQLIGFHHRGLLKEALT